MAVPDPTQVRRLRGLLQDLAFVLAHGIAGMAGFGVVRFLGRTLDKLFENRDLAVSGMTQLIIHIQSFMRTYWYLLPLLLVVDFYVMRLGRRWSVDDRPAAGYSTAVMLVLILALSFAVLMLVHPFVLLIKSG